MSASEGQEVAAGTIQTLEIMRADHDWRLFWMYVCEEAKKISLPLPSSPRKRGRPARYQLGNAEPEFPKSPDYHFHQIWNESFDLANEGIKQRFDQPGYNVMKN